jgi:hypothetical protein
MLSVSLALALCLGLSPISAYAEPKDENTTQATTEATTEATTAASTENNSETTTEATTENKEKTTENKATATDATVTDATPPEDSVDVSGSAKHETEDVSDSNVKFYSIEFRGDVWNMTDYTVACNAANVAPVTNSDIKLVLTPQDPKKVPLEIVLSSNTNYRGYLSICGDETYTITVAEQNEVIEQINIQSEINISQDSVLEFHLKYVEPEQKEKKNPFIELLKNNIFFLILLAGCGIALFIADYKKRNVL